MPKLGWGKKSARLCSKGEYRVIADPLPTAAKVRIETVEHATLRRGLELLQGADVLEELTHLQLTILLLRKLNFAGIRRASVKEIAALLHISERHVQRHYQIAVQKIQGAP